MQHTANITCIDTPFDTGFNDRLLRDFQLHHLEPQVRRSHLFHGRYENIYLTPAEAPDLEALLELARDHARELTGVRDIRAGSWFNYMPPGAVTTRHNHDNEDELLSAVYYVTAPEASGDLIIHTGGTEQRFTPRAGRMIFFPPDVDHEVTVNASDGYRLSIAINFGPGDD